MPRKPSTRPWFHKASGYWSITIQGKRHYLDRDYKIACRKLIELRSRSKREDAGAVEWLDESFATLANEYLADLQRRRAAGTYRANRYRLLCALKILGTDVTVGQFKKFHLARLEQEMTESYSPTTIADTITALQSVFNFAIRMDLLTTNPLIGYSKPSRRGRTRIIEPDEFQALLRNTDSNFRRLLIAARLTGCRPGELRNLKWNWVNLEKGFVVIPDHKTITTQRNPMPRIIPLPIPIWKLAKWLHTRREKGQETVFLNCQGGPYSKDGIVKKMQRLRERAGIKAKSGENLTMYSNRHSYATAVAGKVSDFELATLLGHTDTSMIKRYVHLNADRLRDIERRASGSG